MHSCITGPELKSILERLGWDISSVRECKSTVTRAYVGSENPAYPGAREVWHTPGWHSVLVLKYAYHPDRMIDGVVRPGSQYCVPMCRIPI